MTRRRGKTRPNLDPGISKRIRNGSSTMVNLKSFPDEKQCSPDNIPSEQYSIFLHAGSGPYNFVYSAPYHRDKNACREDENSLKKFAGVSHFDKESEPEGIAQVDSERK